MSTKRNQAPHEGLFLKIFQNLDNARHFLKKHMSENSRSALTWIPCDWNLQLM
ncbi:hypothetical protein [Desulfonatronospira thiodismutans]|uniref:hypothetical protein n=1 Tax=Desulfonatronospira thiodismutans TaxID=488939 RepID=UPI001FCA196D|nr:hypothetical protein [Desulfonatronospira thiodismutans]